METPQLAQAEGKMYPAMLDLFIQLHIPVRILKDTEELTNYA